MTAADAAQASAEALQRIYSNIGMPTRLRELNIPREQLPLLAQDTLKNFNANPGGRSADYAMQMQRLLEAAW